MTWRVKPLSTSHELNDLPISTTSRVANKNIFQILIKDEDWKQYCTSNWSIFFLPTLKRIVNEVNYINKKNELTWSYQGRIVFNTVKTKQGQLNQLPEIIYII